MAFFGTVAKFWSNSRPKLDRVTERARTRTSRPTTRTMATWSGKFGSLALSDGSRHPFAKFSRQTSTLCLDGSDASDASDGSDGSRQN